MANVFPPIESIITFKVKPTDGELAALIFLQDYLDSTYEIYFQPFLNGDLPDIIILRKSSGAYILEVKDWRLENYILNKKKKWCVIKNNLEQPIKSPLKQVNSYKENLYNLHIEGLLERKINNPKLLSVVSCGVYFHNASTAEVDSFIKSEKDSDREDKVSFSKYLKSIKYIDLIGRDGLQAEFWDQILRRTWLDRKSNYFDETLYSSFRRYLQPPIHKTEEGINIVYSQEQQNIIESRQNVWQKIKGIAGSGKTLCLAKRAVNAHLRHQSKVLILTFNISLRNYIHDKISEVREDFKWQYFHIIHYHEFFKNQANNFNLELNQSSWSNPDFFQDHAGQIEKYETILIDEIQDYRKEWVSIILKYFLESESGEYVAFGDEKQNIYQREYSKEEKKPYTGIPGAWNLLKRSYRINTDIALLAKNFQIEYFTSKYDLDDMLISRDIFDTSKILYYPLTSIDPDYIVSLYRKIAEIDSIHENDICIQSAKVEILRELDFKIRNKYNCKVNTMFESNEEYNMLKSSCEITDEEITKIPKIYISGPNASIVDRELIKKYEKFKESIETIRRNKKFNYYDNRGFLKMSTIHSFKGWEIHTLLLIIEDEKNKNGDKDFVTEELIYTAITRCRQNLIIININNPQYHSFFQNQIDKNAT